MIQAELTELLRCPQCRGRLTLQATGEGLECPACRVLYPIVDDIPQLLVEEAKPIRA